jgi:hypothetical protein
VDEFEGGIVAARRDVVHPPGRLLAVAVRAGAVDDDADTGHDSFSAWTRINGIDGYRS